MQSKLLAKDNRNRDVGQEIGTRTKLLPSKGSITLSWRFYGDADLPVQRIASPRDKINVRICLREKNNFALSIWTDESATKTKE